MKGVTIQQNWIDAADSLPDDNERGQFYTAVCHYALTGEELPLKGNGKIFFQLIKKEIATSSKRRAAQEQSASKRAEKRQNRLQNSLQNDLQNTGNAAEKENPLASPKEKTKKRDTKVSQKESGLSFADMIPANLQNEVFLKAWASWIKYRQESRKKLTRSTAALQLAALARYPPEHAAATIQRSIERSWQGLFPEECIPPNKQQSKDHTGV